MQNKKLSDDTLCRKEHDEDQSWKQEWKQAKIALRLHKNIDRDWEQYLVP